MSFESIFTHSLPAQEAPLPIERIVCSGGGAKGIVYSGAYKGLEDTGVLTNVKEFAGSSAGAITATFMAIGMNTSDFRKKLLNTSLKKLMGKSVGSFLRKNLPGVSFITKDGSSLEEFIRQNIIETIRKQLDGLQNDERVQNNADFNAISTKFAQKNPKFTFKDLGTLNKLFPDKFKKLIIPAVKFPGGEIQIFNSELTPNVEIALACRASASIPVVLKPAEIEIKEGFPEKFVDGGLYDNLPTDYFDWDENGNAQQNTKPLQTLVFAFGEGLDNRRNQVFQALYGHRWDEAINEAIISNILNEAVQSAKKFTRRDEQLSLMKALELIKINVKNTLDDTVKNTESTAQEAESTAQEVKLTSQEEAKFKSALELVILDLVLNPEKNKEFWVKYKNATHKDKQLNLLNTYLKRNLQPILYKAGIFERFKRNFLVELLGDLKLSFKNTFQKEVGYQKLRNEFFFRTIELRVGDIKTTHFDKATQLARVMDALGYLDTINHITNHHLHNSEQLDADGFYSELVHYFKNIHCAVLEGAGIDSQKDRLLVQIEAMHERLRKKGYREGLINQQIYQHLIKEEVENKLYSAAAFSFSRAVEFRNKILTPDDLFKEVYEESFKRTGMLSSSNVTGQRVFRASTLRKALENKSMFTLFNRQANLSTSTRSTKIFNSLHQIANFAHAYEDFKRGREDERFSEAAPPGPP